MESARSYNGSANSVHGDNFQQLLPRPRLPVLQTCFAQPPVGRPRWHGNLTTDTNSLTASNAILISWESNKTLIRFDGRAHQLASLPRNLVLRLCG